MAFRTSVLLRMLLDLETHGGVDPLGVKVKSSMARSLPLENLLPQNVGSIINYLQ